MVKLIICILGGHWKRHIDLKTTETCYFEYYVLWRTTILLLGSCQFELLDAGELSKNSFFQGRSQHLHSCQGKNCCLWNKTNPPLSAAWLWEPQSGHSIPSNLTKVSSEQQAALSRRLCSAWSLQEAHLFQAAMQNASPLGPGDTKEAISYLHMRVAAWAS